jgi:hypothetical protein
MSELIAASMTTDTIVGQTSASSITVRGEGSNNTNLQQGLAKEWHLFDQAGNVHGANTIGDSFNVSSCSDVETGHYDVNFTNSMNGTAYSCVSNVHYTGLVANDRYSRFSAPSNLSTSSYRLASQYANNSSEDGYFTSGTSGDLA